MYRLQSARYHLRYGLQSTWRPRPLAKEPHPRATAHTSSRQFKTAGRQQALAMADTNEFMNKFFKENPVDEESIKHFSSIPWTNSFLSNKAYEPIPTYSRVLKPTGEDYFFSVTVKTPKTIPHYLTLRAKEITFASELEQVQSSKSDVPRHKQVTVVPETPECIFLISFGPQGVDGHPGVVHGGVSCAILDETMGLMAMLHQNEAANESGPRDLLYTGNLNVSYRERVPTPGEVIVRTWMTHRSGRKWYSKGQIVDKHGKVLVEGEGLWIVSSGSSRL